MPHRLFRGTKATDRNDINCRSFAGDGLRLPSNTCRARCDQSSIDHSSNRSAHRRNGTVMFWDVAKPKTDLELGTIECSVL
jgi:hypothetical protein